MPVVVMFGGVYKKPGERPPVLLFTPIYFDDAETLVSHIGKNIQSCLFQYDRESA
jgi:hypothetical protein